MCRDNIKWKRVAKGCSSAKLHSLIQGSFDFTAQTGKLPVQHLVGKSLISVMFTRSVE